MLSSPKFRRIAQHATGHSPQKELGAPATGPHSPRRFCRPSRPTQGKLLVNVLPQIQDLPFCHHSSKDQIYAVWGLILAREAKLHEHLDKAINHPSQRGFLLGNCTLRSFPTLNRFAKKHLTLCSVQPPTNNKHTACTTEQTKHKNIEGPLMSSFRAWASAIRKLARCDPAKGEIQLRPVPLARMGSTHNLSRKGGCLVGVPNPKTHTKGFANSTLSLSWASEA